MKYNIKKGSIGIALIPYRINRPENQITIRYKKIRESKIAKQIRISIEEGIGYDQIARDIGISKIDILTIHNKYSLRYGNGITKVNIVDMINRGIDTSDIAEFFDCKESKVIAILREINNKDYIKVEKEIDTAIQVKEFLDESLDIKAISKELKISRYEAFTIYNKYFEVYSDKVIDLEVVESLIDLNLSNNDVAQFYGITKEHVLKIREINREMKKTSKHDTNKPINIGSTKSENILDKAYKSSNKDFYELKMKNRSKL